MTVTAYTLIVPKWGRLAYGNGFNLTKKACGPGEL